MPQTHPNRGFIAKWTILHLPHQRGALALRTFHQRKGWFPPVALATLRPRTRSNLGGLWELKLRLPNHGSWGVGVLSFILILGFDHSIPILPYISYKCQGIPLETSTSVVLGEALYFGGPFANLESTPCGEWGFLKFFLNLLDSEIWGETMAMAPQSRAPASISLAPPSAGWGLSPKGSHTCRAGLRDGREPYPGVPKAWGRVAGSFPPCKSYHAHLTHHVRITYGFACVATIRTDRHIRVWYADCKVELHGRHQFNPTG
jgi:hypothetical protein